MAIYGEDTDWGRSFGAAIKEQLEAEGWETVAEEYFAIDQTEFYPLLNKFVDLNPALVAGTSTAAPAMSAFIKQADEVGLESLIIADGLGWFGEWYDLTGSSSNYVIDQIPGWATAEGKAFAEQFEAEQGFPPSPSAGGLSYDGTNFFISLAKAVYRQSRRADQREHLQLCQGQRLDRRVGLHRRHRHEPLRVPPRHRSRPGGGQGLLHLSGAPVL